MKQQIKNTLLCLSVATSTLLLLSACDNKPQSAEPGANAQAAQTGSVTSDGTTTRSVSGIQIEDVREGNGGLAKKGDTVSVNYLGTLASNGEKFDSSYDRHEPITFRLGAGQVIEGWEKGIEGMKVGGKRILTIPPDKAYGADGYPPVIPPNATLKFEVELVDVK